MVKTISPAAIKKMLCYYYLVSYCPPKYISELEKASREMKSRLAEAAGLSMDEFTRQIAPEVTWRMVAFHEATRKPTESLVRALSLVLVDVDRDPQKAAVYQAAMEVGAAHPGRAKPANRLHRQKGCDFCLAPCRYALFTLMSEPDFSSLQALLDAENEKIAQERNAVKALWTYTRELIWDVLGNRAGVIHAAHLGNLSYCLLLLGTAKSRFALPEKQLIIYQGMNQATIQRLPSPVISLAPPG